MPTPMSLFRRLFSVLAVLAVTASVPATAVAGGAAADHPGPLVSAAWLKARLADPDLVIVDIRSALDGGGQEAYLKAHIPGAVHSDYDKAGWRVTRSNIPLMLPTVPELEKLIGELGIDEDSHVVVVPAGGNVLDFGAAARVYWTLKVLGHDKVSILDGGFAAWTADPANPTESGRHPPSPRIFTAALDRVRGVGLPGGKAAVENRHLGKAGRLEGPVNPRRRPEVERAHAGRRHDDMAVLVDAELADQLLELGRRRQHEWNAVAGDAPAGFVVVAVHGARDVAARIGVGAAAIDRRAYVDHDDLGAAEASLQPGRRHERVRGLRECGAGERKHGSHPDEVADKTGSGQGEHRSTESDLTPDGSGLGGRHYRPGIAKWLEIKYSS